MPTKMIVDRYWYQIEKGNEIVYEDLVHYIGMRNKTPTLVQNMENVTALDTSLNKSQPGSGSGTNTNTTRKVSPRTIDTKKRSTTGTAGTAKDNGSTCNNCGQDRHILGNCPNCKLIKKLLDQALVCKDASIVKSGCQHKDKTNGGAPTGQKESRRLAEEEETKHEIDSEAECELKTLADLDFGAGYSNEGQ